MHPIHILSKHILHEHFDEGERMWYVEVEHPDKNEPFWCLMTKTEYEHLISDAGVYW